MYVLACECFSKYVLMGHHVEIGTKLTPILQFKAGQTPSELGNVKAKCRSCTRACRLLSYVTMYYAFPTEYW